jgi:hypothetical protein
VKCFVFKAGLATLVAFFLAAAPVQADWSSTPKNLRQESALKQEFRVFCPAATTLYTVYGSNPYTSNSSICTAALHSGMFVQGTAVYVSYRIAPGYQSYPGSTNWGVTTFPWGQWNSSFVILGAFLAQ